MPRLIRALLAAGTLLGCTLHPGALAAEPVYPTHVVRIIVPYPPGGFNDTLGRLAAKHLGLALKQPVVVENKPGAGTMIGTREAAEAAPDGHTLLVVQFPFAANPWLYPDIPYDTATAFAPVLLAGRSPMLLVTHAKSPLRTMRDLVDAARRRPDTLAYGSSGPGSSNHLAMALFETASDTRLRQIPFKGSTPMLTALAGAQFDVAVDLLPHAMPFMQSGRVRPLAIAAAQRSPLLPDVPTAAEQGLAGYEATSWHGFVVPAGTSPAIIDRLNRVLNDMLRAEEVRQVFAAQGVVPDGGTPQAMQEFVESQKALWKQVVQERAITVD